MWNYKIVILDFDTPDRVIEEEINKRSKDGWRMVGTLPRYGEGGLRLVFERAELEFTAPQLIINDYGPPRKRWGFFPLPGGKK